MTEAAADAVAAPNDVAIAPPNNKTVRERGRGSLGDPREAALDETKEWR